MMANQFGMLPPKNYLDRAVYEVGFALDSRSSPPFKKI